MKEPNINIGIVSSEKQEFLLHGKYHVNGEITTGKHTVTCQDSGLLHYKGAKYEELLFEPTEDNNSYFELIGVTIGINFHWERKENQRFKGKLKLICSNNKVIAINTLPLEEYLMSVISSEMSATSSLELLKAHAIISRSWLMAQMKKNKTIQESKEVYESRSIEENEYTRWYDREDHLLFDVCADDHCQRYQGISRAYTPIVKEAIKATFGQVLTYNGAICDARFSKCCGGMLEEFQYCWEDKKHPYLKGKRDDNNGLSSPDLTLEENARKWILDSPNSYCNTQDGNVLKQVLNDYDQETNNFYRWKVSYSQKELSKILLQRSGIDFGEIINLIPIARGTSGRIYRLKIVGTKQIYTIGKELEIRRVLSTSHLYSSAFIVERENIDSMNIPQQFTLFGAGWGHGVGLCQIGAAMMIEQGKDYKSILLHYYTNANIEQLY